KQEQTPKEKNKISSTKGQVERAPTSKGSDRSPFFRVRTKTKWGKKGKKWITSKTEKKKKRRWGR
ncbi:unnamed protein product, partial [Ixodes persulcatus]